MCSSIKLCKKDCTRLKATETLAARARQSITRCQWLGAKHSPPSCANSRAKTPRLLTDGAKERCIRHAETDATAENNSLRLRLFLRLHRNARQPCPAWQAHSRRRLSGTPRRGGNLQLRSA